MQSLTFRDVPHTLPKDQVLAVFTSPENAWSWVACSVAHQGSVLALLHCDVRACFLIRDIRRNWNTSTFCCYQGWRDHDIGYCWEHCAPVTVLRNGDYSTACSTAFVFVSAFAKQRKATTSLVMSALPFVCPSAWNNAAPTGRILIKVEYFSKICR